jgi:HPr kinase/phosphorylase
MLVHGTAIAVDGRAVLLMGPSRSGKSDLALRAIDAGAALIADDLVAITLDAGHLTASRHDPASPRLALRGIGIVQPDCVADTALLSLCVQLDRHHDASSLTPQLGKAGPWHGLYVPQIMLNPFEASALIKLHFALTRFGF